MPLDAAVQEFFPHGGATKSTLLAACRKGALAYAKIGNRYLVTEADIQGWIEKCREKQKAQGSGLGNAKAAKPDTSSSTEADKSTLDLALTMSGLLKGNLVNTSQVHTGQTQANVIRLKSRYRKS